MNEDEMVEYRQWLASQETPAADPVADPAEMAEYRQWNAQQREEPSFMASMGRGFMDVGQGMKQLFLTGMDQLGYGQAGQADAYTQQVNDEIDLYQRGRGEDPGFDWGRMAGNALPLAPVGGLATTIPRAAALGAAEGAAMFSPQGADSTQKAMQTGIGGLAGGSVAAVAPYAGNALTRLQQMLQGVARRYTPATSEGIGNALQGALRESGIDLNQLSDDMANRINQNVGEALQAGNVDPAAAARKAVFEELGFSGNTAPTQAQLSRKASQWRDEQELSKLTGGEALNQRYVNQSNRYREITEEMRESIGGAAQDDIQASMGSFDDIIKQWNDSQIGVADAYKRARLEDPGATVTLDKFKGQIDEFIELGEDSVSPHITAAATMLKNKGLMQQGDEVVMRDLSMEQTENLRKVLVQRMGSAIKSHDSNAVRVIRKLTAAMDDDIAFAGPGFSAAREAASKRFEKFSGESVSKMTKGAGNETNFINTKIIGGKPDDIADIKAMHMNGDPQAWSDIKGRVYEHLMTKSFQGGGEAGTFSGRMLGKNLRKMGDSRLKVIFNPEELSKLKLMAKSGEWATSEVPMSNVNNSNSASTFGRMLQGAGKLPAIRQMVGSSIRDFKAGAALKSNTPMESIGSEVFEELSAARADMLRRAMFPAVPLAPAESTRHPETEMR